MYLATINVYKDENVEFSIKRFRKEVEKEAILKEMKDRQYYHKPALVRKEEKVKLEKRVKRKNRKRNNMGF